MPVTVLLVGAALAVAGPAEKQAHVAATRGHAPLMAEMIPLSSDEIREKVLGNIISSEAAEANATPPADSGFIAYYKDNVAIQWNSFTGPRRLHFDIVGNKILFPDVKDAQGAPMLLGCALYKSKRGILYLQSLNGSRVGPLAPVVLKRAPAPPAHFLSQGGG